MHSSCQVANESMATSNRISLSGRGESCSAQPASAPPNPGCPDAPCSPCQGHLTLQASRIARPYSFSPGECQVGTFSAAEDPQWKPLSACLAPSLSESPSQRLSAPALTAHCQSPPSWRPP